MIIKFATGGFRYALTELDFDGILRALHWNPKTREEAHKQNPYPDVCPDGIFERQAAVYREVMEAVVSSGKLVDRVTVWGISDRHSWLNSYFSPN